MTNLTFTVFEATPEEIAQRGGFCLDQYQPFDANDYAEVYGLNVSDIDPQDVHAVQDAQSQLGKDFWIAVDHK